MQATQGLEKIRHNLKLFCSWLLLQICSQPLGISEIVSNTVILSVKKKIDLVIFMVHFIVSNTS